MAEATVTANATTVQPSRRALLGMTTALGAAGVVTAAALAGEQDPHLAWEEERKALRAQMRLVDDDDELNELVDEELEVVDRICSTPAGTLAGIAVQIRAVAFAIDENDGPDASEREGLANALRSLEQLAGRA